MTNESRTAPVNARHIHSWDEGADVVVVGYGAAGASTALGAASQNAQVMLIERSSGHGGATAMAGGEIYLGGGTPTQRACGYQDTPEAMYEFLMAATGPDADEKKIALYCEQSLSHYEWLVSHGIEFKPALFDRPAYEPRTDEGLMFTGGENAYPFDQLAPPAPRGHIPRVTDKVPGSRGGGWMLLECLAASVDEAGIDVQTDMTVERLVIDDDGRVVGVIARRYGKEITVEARRGIVLTAGGFVYNETMLAQHAPMLVGCSKVGSDSEVGSSIQMAQHLGAAVRHMDAGQAAIQVPPPLLFPSVLVNRRGQRFINEDTYPGRVGQVALFSEKGHVYLICDAETFESIPLIERFGIKAPTWVAETIAELESEIGLPIDSLTHTIEEYNLHATNGEDPLCHKRSEWLRPLKSPFGAMDLTYGAFSVFTLGGLHTNCDGEVLDVSGNAIPGLFAAGRTSSGLPAWGYISGTSLADCTFFGRRAGIAAAKAQ